MMKKMKNRMLSRRYAVAICLLGLIIPDVKAQSDKCAMPEQKIKSRVDFFHSTNYSKLFLRGSKSLSDSVWALDSSREILECIVEKNDIDGRSRFFAAEVLFTHSKWRPEGPLKRTVALLYAEALKENYTDIANPWGLPDDLGNIGKHVILLDEEAIKAFSPLLDCRIPLTYAGSRAATAGMLYKYRVKDVAATYISEQLGRSFNGERAPLLRNIQIRKLKHILRKQSKS